MAESAAVPMTHNQPAYTVSEIALGVKHLVEENFGRVRVRGEVSKVSVNSASGHCYFSLKDDKALLDAVCWKGSMAKLAHKPEMGLEVIATGKMTTYPGSSKYQLVVDRIEPAGEGALMALLEKRKKQLAAEGLFDEARKKAIPFLPSIIGVVTSPTGAVIRDILHRIEDRFPRHVIVWPVAVQGEQAAAQVAAAIQGFNAMTENRPDVLIVARGGGSIEDLWGFNEEIVVRAAAASAIPLISAVGHETDTTLIDFASDKRAPTPTAAAEMAVPVRAEWIATVMMHESRAHVAVQRMLQHRMQHMEALAHALPKPQQILQVMMQRLDDWSERLDGALPRLAAAKLQQFEGMANRLKPALLVPMLQQGLHNVMLQVERMNERMRARVQQEEHKVALLARVLETMDVRAVLQRGFALVRGKDGLITRADAASSPMQIEWADGKVDVIRADSSGKKQGDLF